MYDNLSSRLRGEAEVSDASPYIKELMKQAADSLDNLNIAVQKLTGLFPAPEALRSDQLPGGGPLLQAPKEE